jgi:hypothetical protein
LLSDFIDNGGFMSERITRHSIGTLQQFYELMDKTAGVRRRVVQDLLVQPEGADAAKEDIDCLRAALENLIAIPGPETKNQFERLLFVDNDHHVHVNLTYEISELARDVVFLELGEAALLTILEDQSPGLLNQAYQLADKLAQTHSFRCLVTDRDGTVNNYCGRYRSSIQSIYNALFLTRFARKRIHFPIMVTSGPLSGPGLLDVSVLPPKTFIMAASKGREYIDLTDAYGNFPAQDEQTRLLKALQLRLEELLKQEKYRKFGLIGSGLQVKFGQLTVARQDISDSVPSLESEDFLKTITKLVRDHDPDGDTLRIEDTGLDIEIILTIESGKQRKDFDKGDGVAFLNEALALDMGEGPHLVCGDTFSDLPMLRVTLEKCSDTQAVFVTRDKELHQAVLKLCPQALIVAEPDVLVLALNKLAC